jgi:hypothetical protein
VDRALHFDATGNLALQVKSKAKGSQELVLVIVIRAQKLLDQRQPWFAILSLGHASLAVAFSRRDASWTTGG